MTPKRCALAAALLALVGCATVEEPSRPSSEVEQPPVVAERLPPAVKPAPPIVQPPAPPVAPPAPQVARASEVDTLLADFARLRRSPPADVAREQEAARQAFTQSRSDAARVRLALALAVPGNPGSEDTRALELLDPLVKNPTAPLHGIAFLMAAYIQEQRRLGSQLLGLQQNAQALQQNVQALQQKLDALRSLERSLTERESGPVRRR